MMSRKTWVWGLALFLVAIPVRADVVWPALYLETRLLTWWAVGLGLAVEYLFVRQLFGFGVRRAIVVNVTMNLASTLLGVLLIPLAGIAWELFPGSLIHWAFDVGTFNPATWAGTFLLAVAINAVLEGLVIRWGFKVPVDRRIFAGLCVANAISVGMAMTSLFIFEVSL